MKRSPRKPPQFDLTTRCTACGYAIPPAELVRVGWATVQCPKCGAESSPKPSPIDRHR